MEKLWINVQALQHFDRTEGHQVGPG